MQSRPTRNDPNRSLAVLMAAVLAGLACTENSRPSEDLGPFVSRSQDTGPARLDYPRVEGFTVEIAGPYIVLAGLTRLMTPSEPDLGEPLPHVRITVRDMTQAVLAETESDDSGAFILAVPIRPGGTDGYVELTKDGYPTVRQFDRPFDEPWTNMRLRMLDETLYSIPRQLLSQQDSSGYVQGSVYDRTTEVPLSGVRVVASAGTVAYLSDGVPLPKTDLTETQSQGVFFVANCPPGPVTLRLLRGDEEVSTRTVLTWPGGVLTQVGVPVRDARSAHQ